MIKRNMTLSTFPLHAIKNRYRYTSKTYNCNHRSLDCNHESVLPPLKNEPRVTRLPCNIECGLYPRLYLFGNAVERDNCTATNFMYCTACVLSGAVPCWPCLYVYSLSEITETKHEAFTQSTLWPLYKLLPRQCFQWNHVIYGVLMRTHNYNQSGFLLVMQFIFALRSYGNHLVRTQEWQCLKHILYCMLCLGWRYFEVIWNIKFLLKLIKT